jgi:hypothetical protein
MSLTSHGIVLKIHLVLKYIVHQLIDRDQLLPSTDQIIYEDFTVISRFVIRDYSLK